MNKLAFVTVIVWVAGMSLLGCALFTPQNIKTALQDSEVACVIAHRALPNSKLIAKVCSIDESLTNLVDTVLQSFSVSNKTGVHP